MVRLDDQKHVVFLNINHRFLNKQGGLISFRPSENLHAIEEGYEICASAFIPRIKRGIQ